MTTATLTTQPKEKVELGEHPKITPLDKFPVESIPLNMVCAPKGNHRHSLSRSKEDIESLAATLREKSQLAPILVYKEIGKEDAEKWTIGYGFGRMEALRLNKAESVRAILATGLQPFEIEYYRSIENMARLALNPVDEANAIANMLRTCPYKSTNQAIAYVAECLGKSTTFVRDRSYLIRLDPRVCDLIIKGQLPLGQAREIAILMDYDEQWEVAELAKQAEDGSFGKTLDWVKAAVASRLRSLKTVPFVMTVAFADGPACDGCPNNTTNDAGLFEHDKGDGPEFTCNKNSCFSAKMKEANKKLDAVVAKYSDKVISGEIAATAGALEAAGAIPNILKPTTVANRLRRIADEVKATGTTAPRDRETGKKITAEEFIRTAYSEIDNKHRRDQDAKEVAAFQAAWAKIEEAHAANPWVGICMGLLDRTEWYEGIAHSRGAATKSEKQLRKWIKECLENAGPDLALKIIGEEKHSEKGRGCIHGPFKGSRRHGAEIAAVMLKGLDVTYEPDLRGWEELRKAHEAEARRLYEESHPPAAAKDKATPEIEKGERAPAGKKKRSGGRKAKPAIDAPKKKKAKKAKLVGGLAKSKKK